MSRPDPQSLPSIDPVDSVKNICFSFGPFNNRAIRALFQQDVVLIPYSMSCLIGMDLLIISVGKKFGCCHTHTYLLTKIKEFPLKLFINIILPTTIWRSLRKTSTQIAPFVMTTQKQCIFWQCIHVRTVARHTIEIRWNIFLSLISLFFWPNFIYTNVNLQTKKHIFEPYKNKLNCILRRLNALLTKKLLEM